jgi:alcohol dehydrogenase
MAGNAIRYKGPMRAVLYEQFRELPAVVELPDPTVPPDGVVLRVEATGLCRSDWHGWQGHDSDITPPHVPGHELAGSIVEVGPLVRGWQVGQRVAVPFICACGSCPQCRTGNQQVCPNQLQPGFNYWGSFAEYVAIPFAEVNLVSLPDQISFDTAAALGCRFATSYRAVTAVAGVRPGEWLAVFGCGGIGLSAVMIAAAAGARVIAVDRQPAALELAGRHGAEQLLPSDELVVDRIRELTGGGAEVTIDAIGAESVVQACLGALRPRGRHIQVGVLPEPVRLDLSAFVFRELNMLASHGLAGHEYPRLLELVGSARLRPDQLITSTIGLAEVPDALAAMSTASPTGITMIRPGQS